MRQNELKEIVGKECEFLSYYLEECENQLTTNPKDMELIKMRDSLRDKWVKYNKVYDFIRDTLE